MLKQSYWAWRKAYTSIGYLLRESSVHMTKDYPTHSGGETKQITTHKKTPNNFLMYISWETTFKWHLINLLFDWQVILLNGDRVVLSLAIEEAIQKKNSVPEQQC